MTIRQLVWHGTHVKRVLFRLITAVAVIAAVLGSSGDADENPQVNVAQPLNSSAALIAFHNANQEFAANLLNRQEEFRKKRTERFKDRLNILGDTQIKLLTLIPPVATEGFDPAIQHFKRSLALHWFYECKSQEEAVGLLERLDDGFRNSIRQGILEEMTDTESLEVVFDGVKHEVRERSIPLQKGENAERIQQEKLPKARLTRVLGVRLELMDETFLIDEE